MSFACRVGHDIGLEPGVVRVHVAQRNVTDACRRLRQLDVVGAIAADADMPPATSPIHPVRRPVPAPAGALRPPTTRLHRPPAAARDRGVSPAGPCPLSASCARRAMGENRRRLLADDLVRTVDRSHEATTQLRLTELDEPGLPTRIGQLGPHHQQRPCHGPPGTETEPAHQHHGRCRAWDIETGCNDHPAGGDRHQHRESKQARPRRQSALSAGERVDIVVRASRRHSHRVANVTIYAIWRPAAQTA